MFINNSFGVSLQKKKRPHFLRNHYKNTSIRIEEKKLLSYKSDWDKIFFTTKFFYKKIPQSSTYVAQNSYITNINSMALRKNWSPIQTIR